MGQSRIEQAGHKEKQAGISGEKGCEGGCEEEGREETDKTRGKKKREKMGMDRQQEQRLRSMEGETCGILIVLLLQSKH